LSAIFSSEFLKNSTVGGYTDEFKTEKSEEETVVEFEKFQRIPKPSGFSGWNSENFDTNSLRNSWSRRLYIKEFFYQIPLGGKAKHQWI
jgi:hypothetical protein